MLVISTFIRIKRECAGGENRSISSLGRVAGRCIAQITCAVRCSQVHHRSTPSSVSFPYVSININGVRWALNGKGGRIVALSIQVSLPRSQWFPNTPRFACYETASSVTYIPDQPLN